MKKVFSIIAVLVLSIVATANKTIDTRTNNVVYFVEGANEYHTSALSAHIHAGVGQIMMQRESGCKQSGMHKCLLCKGAELINNIK